MYRQNRFCTQFTIYIVHKNAIYYKCIVNLYSTSQDSRSMHGRQIIARCNLIEEKEPFFLVRT